MKRLLALMLGLLSLSVGAENLPNLLVREGGARVVAFSSATGGADVDQLLPPRTMLDRPGVDLNDFVWCSADNAPFPHWALFEFQKPQWLTTLVFNNELNDEMAYPGIAARQVEIWAGSTSKDELVKVASFQLERNRNGQSVRIDPVQVRWLKFVIVSNWGNATWTEVSAFAAYDDGSRPAEFSDTLKASGRADVYGIYFDFASASLRPESRKALEDILNYHRVHPEQKLIVEGHTDSVGPDTRNHELSQRRAQAVVDALVHMGGEARRFGAVGFGAKRPVADNGSEAGRARNRRVSVSLG